MNKNDIMKYVLIAGAVYLVYRYLGAQAVQKDIASGEQTTPPTPGTGTKEITDGQTDAGDIAQSLVAAMQAAGYDPQGSYNGYEWNWFWQRSTPYNGSNIGPTELGISDTDKVYLTDAVAAIRKTLTGVSGLARLESLMASPKMMSAWGM